MTQRAGAVSARSGIRVFASTAVELLARLYAHAHTVRGDFEPPPAPVSPAPPGHDEAIAWFFGDDVAFGMNLAVFAVENKWADVSAMISGLRSCDIPRIVKAMLRTPSATVSELRRRDHLIQQVCAGRASSPSAFAAAAASDGFSPDSVARLLTEPGGAVETLMELLNAAAATFVGDEETAAAAKLTTAVRAVSQQLHADQQIAVALSRVTGGWTLRDADRYEVTLVPCESLRPYLVTRVVADARAVVVFGGTVAPSRNTAELAEALKVLGNPQRLAILNTIANLPATGQDLAELLGLTEATVHHHTSALRSARLITSEREGVRVYHQAAKEEISELLADVSRSVFGA